MNGTYEDVFFYLDLTKEILKKKELIKAIKHYITEKNKINILGHYGLLIFQEEGNPIFITDKKDSEIILKAVDENWKTRPKKQSYFENGLFYIFSYIAETVRKKSKLNRIIIITDTPSDLSEDYTDALFNLVSKIKNFPTFIDILRLSQTGERFFKDDVKLNILASDTRGGIFYIQDKKEFISTINKLIKSKRIVSIFEEKSAKIRIRKEDYDFYSRLAREVVPAPSDEPGLKCTFCKDEICPVCTNINDIPLLCPQCNTAFHKCCVTNHTIQHNIGIPHIFRCPNCDTLLKINQDEIVIPEDPKRLSAEAYIETETIEDVLEIENTQEDKPHIPIQESELNNLIVEDKEKVSFDSEESHQFKSKAVRVGGYFGKMYTVKKEGDKIVYQRSSKDTVEPESNELLKTPSEQEPKSLEKVTNKITYWKPPKSQKNEKEESNLTICPECGSSIKKENRINNSCQFCGHKFED